ncbi:MAG: four helix bundle protein [Planctomycetaceae bacterium]|nr:four helix bundle protein [Planctomycetaceae bacterium]
MRMAGLRDRTKQFALRVIRLSSALPPTTQAQVIGKQLLRSGTSVAANFREASRARSNAEFKSKVGIVLQELDESLLWFELLTESEIISLSKLEPLMQETEELIKIMIAASRNTS